MKKRIQLLTLLFGIALHARSVEKHALLIGNAKYTIGWSPLCSDNDLNIMNATLLEQKFAPGNIIILKDATKTQMLAAFDKLYNEIHPDDIVVVHYSGHGHQLCDVKPLDEVDGYDEALVGIDADPEMQDISKYLIDDELGAIVKKIRKKLGKKGHLLILLDSCHSGSGARGGAKGTVRGGYEVPGCPKGNIDYNQISSDNIDVEDKEADLSKFVLISGSAANQCNFQVRVVENGKFKEYGSLSYAFANVMSDIKEKETYSTLFSRIESFISKQENNGQIPVIEGDKDYMLFNNTMIPRKTHTSITSIAENDGKLEYVTDGGTFMNYFKDSRVVICPSSAANPDSSNIVAKGRIISAEKFSSTLEITDGKILTAKNMNDYIVFMDSVCYQKDYVIRIVYDQKDPLLKRLADFVMDQYKFVTYDKDADYKIVHEGDSVFINKVQDGETNFRSAASEAVQDENITSFSDVFQYNYQTRIVRDIDFSNSNSNCKIDVRLIPANIQFNNRGDAVKIDTNVTAASRGNDYVFNLAKNHTDLRQGAILELQNVGSADFYYVILDINAEGNTSLLYPDPDSKETVEEYFLKRDAKVRFDNLSKVLVFSKPYGKEEFKIICTDKPLTNIKSIFKSAVTRGECSPKINDPLEKLFDTSFQNTRADRIKPKVDEGYSKSIFFTIENNLIK